MQKDKKFSTISRNGVILPIFYWKAICSTFFNYMILSIPAINALLGCGVNHEKVIFENKHND
jgi:hypothetical protein